METADEEHLLELKTYLSDYENPDTKKHRMYSLN